MEMECSNLYVFYLFLCSNKLFNPKNYHRKHILDTTETAVTTVLDQDMSSAVWNRLSQARAVSKVVFIVDFNLK